VNRTTTDLVIVGAGPAGTAAAITARQANRSVIIIDKATFPREKICGDGLTTSCLRLLERLGLDPSTVPSWQAVDDVVVTSPSGTKYTYPLPQNNGSYAAIAERRDLDFAMVQLARTHGVEIREGTALDTIVNETDTVRITTTNGSTIEAKYAIAADGMWSPTRKALGLATPGYLGEWHALRQYFRNVNTSTEHELFVWFDADLLPGYIWSFPLPNGRANVGFGILRGTIKTKDMSRLWADILQRPHIREVLGPKAEPEAPHRAWPIPARVGALPLTLGRTLFVGDAAAATDPMTGEGIGQALWTGIAAVEATLGAPTPEAVRTEYELAVHNHLVIDHRFAEQLGKILQHPLGTRAAVRVSGATEWTRRNFARWLFEDYPRAILGTPSRWHKNMFSQPGAYLKEQPVGDVRP